MDDKWVAVNGVVVQGHQVASGFSGESPYPKGTIEMQIPFFTALGLDLSNFFKGTLNVSIHPKKYLVKKPEYTFRNINWISNYPAEDFSFSGCRIIFKDLIYNGFVYYPHPDTKINHFHNSSTLEIIAPEVPGVKYECQICLEINTSEIVIV